MSEQKAVLMINARINKANMQDVQSYLGQIMPVFAKSGGKPIARYKTIEELSGEDGPEMTALVEFSNADVIKNMFQSTDFQDLSDLRVRAFTKLNLMICETM